MGREMTHHSTCSMGTRLCALLLSLSFPLEMSCSPKAHLQFLVADIFAGVNRYLPLHTEHSAPGSYRVWGCVRCGCVSLLCPAPWAEQMSGASCFLKCLVWEGCPAGILAASVGLYICAPSKKYPEDSPQMFFLGDTWSCFSQGSLAYRHSTLRFTYVLAKWCWLPTIKTS